MGKGLGFTVFPILKERMRYPGTRLSGGEQQMLVLARVLRMGARLLVMDEPRKTQDAPGATGNSSRAWDTLGLWCERRDLADLGGGLR